MDEIHKPSLIIGLVLLLLVLVLGPMVLDPLLPPWSSCINGTDPWPEGC